MDVPSVKGIAFQVAIDFLRPLLESGRLSREEMEAELQVEDLQIIDQKPAAGLWYPMSSFRRILEFILQKDGSRTEPHQIVQAGVEAAEKLFSSEIYRAFVASAERRGQRSGPLLVKLAPMLSNFATWSYDAGTEEENAFTVEVEGAGEFPEALRHILQGLIQVLAELANGHSVRVTSDRPNPDRIVFTGARGV